jgi:hypothetical protein
MRCLHNLTYSNDICMSTEHATFGDFHSPEFYELPLSVSHSSDLPSQAHPPEGRGGSPETLLAGDENGIVYIQQKENGLPSHEIELGYTKKSARLRGEEGWAG